jgi:hypothetical protein
VPRSGAALILRTAQFGKRGECCCTHCRRDLGEAGWSLRRPGGEQRQRYWRTDDADTGQVPGQDIDRPAHRHPVDSYLNLDAENLRVEVAKRVRQSVNIMTRSSVRTVDLDAVQFLYDVQSLYAV